MKKVVTHPSAQSNTSPAQYGQLAERVEEFPDSTVVELSLKSEQEAETASIKEVVAKNLQQYFLQLGDQDASQLYQLVLNQVEPALLDEVLKHTRGNQSKASEILGLNRGTLRKKLKQHGIS